MLLLRVKRFGWRSLPLIRRREVAERSAVVFYERLTKALARQGMHRPPEQTPLEFAATVGVKEVEVVTSAYNRVRYGAHELSRADLEKIDAALKTLESN
jgi:pyridoxine 5'-phosphate synthase PdxJ